MKEITVRVPSSKSHTHRALLCAALAPGENVIRHPLLSEDTLYTLGALEALGIEVEKEDGALLVKGGELKGAKVPLYLGNSGTSLRFLTAMACLSPSPVLITGSERLKERPVGPLVRALKGWGAEVEDTMGFPPVRAKGGGIRGGTTEVDSASSSQFLSALLLVGPYCQKGAEVRVVGRGVSRPYVEVTLEVMRAFGITPEGEGQSYRIPKGPYRSTVYEVPPDPSSATYPFMAAALTGAKVKVLGLRREGTHPDLGFLGLLEAMGAEVREEDDGVSVKGGVLHGVEVDMADMPDSVPALAVLGAFARGETVIKGIGHLRYKESDRIRALAEGLARMGVEVEATHDLLRIRGGKPRPALIDPHDDHRIAMAFAMASLVVPGLEVSNPGCVAKSFPEFWAVFAQIREAL